MADRRAQPDLQLVTITPEQLAESRREAAARSRNLKQQALSGFVMMNELTQQMKECCMEMAGLSAQQVLTDVRLNALIQVIERLMERNRLSA